jgi:hypothetical protein
MTCNGIEPHEARVVRISDTKHLDIVHVSPTVLEDVRGSTDFEVLGVPVEQVFDSGGYWPPN